jgi:predicted ATP-grasp superfamily ATP-dependent carboligase
MRNRFNINEEEKNRIRLLHGMSVITEQEEEALAVVDDEEVDGDDELVDTITDEEVQAVENSEDEETWLAEKWEDLTDAVRNIFSKTRRFKLCRGRGSCMAFNSTPKQKLRRMLRRIRWQFPRIKWPRIKLFAKK